MVLLRVAVFRDLEDGLLPDGDAGTLKELQNVRECLFISTLVKLLYG